MHHQNPIKNAEFLYKKELTATNRSSDVISHMR